MIRKLDSLFVIDTDHTTYAFRVLDTGHLEHLYYGKRIQIDEGDYGIVLSEKHAFPPGNTNTYDKDHNTFTLEDMRLEMSSYGKGDIRDPFIEVVHNDGSYTSDFLYEDAIVSDKQTLQMELPCAYSEDDNLQELCIVLRDKAYNLKLNLYYIVLPDCDVILRSSELINESSESVSIKRLMSTQLDMAFGSYRMHTFTGGWAREMRKNDIPLQNGRYVNESYTGTTSSRANSFVMVSKKDTTEDFGECMGFHLLYSGNHYEAISKNSFGKIRVLTGINPQSFSWELNPGEKFNTPQAAMTYSKAGFNGMSQNMHHFIKEHIVRGEWKNKLRPVLLNSWEANYFDITESKLVKLAKAGKDVGIELFVMDDGWFGNRDDDTSSLGDWDVNTKKLPNGLKGLCDKIKALDMDFGIWVEPEMVNVNSKLYEAHPDWTLEIPNHHHSEGRNQRVLDLSKTEVQDFIIEKMSEVFSSADISYVKWDMNRTFTDIYSNSLPAGRQGEVAHRYVIGLYRCLKELTERFPHILFEGCSAGGNRFDPGVLCYFPQIWASDDTDAICRSEIQTGYSYGYPMNTVSAHVSACPNHQTLRITPLETRFHVASFGVMGYECNLCDMKSEDVEAIKVQIALYKEWREVLQKGDFYRGKSYGEEGYSVLENSEDNQVEWTCVSKDQKKAVGMLLQKLVVPNTQFTCYNAKGLRTDLKYHFYNRFLKYNVKNFGDLVNTVSPVHIKQDSLAHNLIAKFVKMDGEKEDFIAYGDALMEGGAMLKPAFGGTGYSDEVRHYPDFGSRLYFMEAVEE